MSVGRGIKHSAQVPIVAFFAANPDEEMSAPDVTIKFGFSDRRTAYDALKCLTRDGYLKPTIKTHPRLWRAGPKLLELIGKEE